MGRMFSARIFLLQTVIYSEHFVIFMVSLNNWLEGFNYYDGLRISNEDLRAKENTSSLNLIVLNLWLELSIELQVYRKIVIWCIHTVDKVYKNKMLPLYPAVISNKLLNIENYN